MSVLFEILAVAGSIPASDLQNLLVRALELELSAIDLEEAQDKHTAKEAALRLELIQSKRKKK